MSNFLLDTHTFIWLSENDSNLSNNLREMIDIADRVYLSIASLWEIAIKLNLGKLSLQRSYNYWHSTGIFRYSFIAYFIY